MIQLDELEEAVNAVVEKANKLRNETILEIVRGAPFIVMERLNNQFVEVAKKHSDQLPGEVPEMRDILTARRVLQENFPELKDR